MSNQSHIFPNDNQANVNLPKNTIFFSKANPEEIHRSIENEVRGRLFRKMYNHYFQLVISVGKICASISIYITVTAICTSSMKL